MAEHDDSEIGTALAELVRRADALVGSRRRHADVGHDDVGPLLLHRLHERAVIGARRDELQIRLGADHPPEAFPHQIVILGKHHPQSHRRRLGHQDRGESLNRP